MEEDNQNLPQSAAASVSNVQEVAEPLTIDGELEDIFQKNLQARLQKPVKFSSLLQGALFGDTIMQQDPILAQPYLIATNPQTTNSTTQVANYFTRAKELLFGSTDPDAAIAEIWDDDLTLGVCAKVLKQGDVAWKCEDCEKDPTCIICLDCFNNSDHEGHRTWLKTNVGGCCDCGDPEGWDMKGACTTHKGIDSSKDEALNVLPDSVRERAPEVFRSLTKILKTCLMGVIENKHDIQVMKVYESMISDFMSESDLLLASWKQCIFYLSEAYIEVFYGAHPLRENAAHKCCYRYFPDEDFRSRYEEEKAIFESTQSSFSETNTYCTCTVIDLLFQADQLYNRQEKLAKRVTQQCIQLFQSYNFKQHLGFGYIANMMSFTKHGGNVRGMAQLGVQILTMDSVTSRIFSDTTLCKVLPTTLASMLKDLIENQGGNDKESFFTLRYFRYDLKYIAKPDLMPIVVQNTNIVEGLIEAVYQLHFTDVQKNTSVMDEFGDATLQYLFNYAQADLDIVSVIESKYLSYVERKDDVARLMQYFKQKFEVINETYKAKHADAGFFLVPVHRLFTFLLIRQLMCHYASNQLQGKTSEDLPPTDFHEYLLGQKSFNTSAELQTVIELALISAARQMGFIAEIEAKKWIFKGERFKMISQIEHQAYTEKYLRMIGLFQAGICASANKSRCVDILINNFCVDEWLSVYLMSLGHPNGPMELMFQGMENFAGEKLALQIQSLLLKLIEIAITEASFLVPSQKKLLKDSADAKEKIEMMFAGHLRREMMHVLFRQGANSTIDQIKKASHPEYLTSDKFTQAVIDLSTSQTDGSGKKQFRLNPSGKHEAMFDPYYIVKKNQESAQQTAYDQFYKNNPNCNNIVGDYMQNYKYQTSINRECWQAFAQSELLTEFVSKTIKECLKSQMIQRETANQQTDKADEDNDVAFRQELFPQQTLFMGLKLMIIICQNCDSQETMSLIQEALPAEILTKFFSVEGCKDQKLSDIGLYLKGLIYKEEQKSQADSEETKTQQKASQISQAEALKTKKAAAAKKKAMLLAKMKRKQSNFIAEPSIATPISSSLSNSDATMTECANDQSSLTVPAEGDSEIFSQSCASCQEPLDVSAYFDRPFAQLCYLSSSKLFYYTCRQTVQTQQQSLKNLRDAHHHTDDPKADQQMIVEEETKGEPIINRQRSSASNTSSSFKDSSMASSELGGLVSEEDPHLQWDKMVMQDLQLKDVLDPNYKTGVTFQKCCHAFHFDCLQQYQTAEGNYNPQKEYVRQMVGYDDNCITCPMCKTFKNTWQPFLPLGVDSASNDAEGRMDPKRIEPYVDFCSQLITNHLNSPESDTAEITKKSILTIDIKNDPEAFILKMCSVVTHLVLESTCMKNQTFLAPFNPAAQQNDIILREVVYITMTTKEIVKRILRDDTSQTDILKELGKSLLSKLAIDLANENVFYKNYQKLVVRMLFICAVCLDNHEILHQVKQAVVASMYSSFKAQVLLSDIFRKHFGQIQRGRLPALVQEALDLGDQQSETMVESQLTFLRAATAMSLCIDAMIQCQTQPLASFNSREAMQLNLNVELIEQIRQQVDDQAEFNLLLTYLQLSPSLSRVSIFEKPTSLSQLEAMGEPICYVLMIVSRLDKDLASQVKELSDSAPSADLPQDSGDTAMGQQQQDDDLICMPSVLHLLTTYFAFNLIDLPTDFHKLVKQYYTRQCRGCRKQLQESAICLLCGEIVCHMQTQTCCGNRPGMKQILARRQGYGMFAQTTTFDAEGEASYHARHCEGGNSIFLVPQTATIYMIDQGRILRGESPYRNALGETFSQRSAKWDNYMLSEETGGAQVLSNLRKAYLEHKVPQLILHGRQAGERVIIRHAL